MSRLTEGLWGLGVTIAVLSTAGGARASASSPSPSKGRVHASLDANEVLAAVRGLRRAGAFSDAATTLKKALASGKVASRASELELELARVFIDEKQANRALHECDRLHKLSAFDEQLCVAEAQLLSRRGSVALPAAERALTLSPGSYDASVARGRALTQLGRPADAEALFQELSQTHPELAEAPRFLAALYVAEGKRAAALSALSEARKAQPDDPEVLLLYGETAPPSADTKSALEHALSIRSRFAPASARLGVVKAALGDLDGAVRSLNAALKEDSRQAEWHAALGSVFMAKGDPDSATREAKAALDIVPNHGGAKLIEAEALARKGDVDLAIGAFETAYGFARSDPKVLVEATKACIRGGRLTTAKAFADRATEDFPKSSVAWELEGDVALALKDAPTAHEAYSKALAGEGPADKDAIRRKLASIQ